MDELRFARLQIALIGTRIARTNALELANTISRAAGDALGGEPLVLPVPDDGPSEFPRAILRSRDGRGTCQVAGNRLDLMHEVPPEALGSDCFAAVRERQTDLASDIWEALQGQLGAIGTRIGFISVFALDLENPVGFLRRRFLATSNAPEPRELQMQVLLDRQFGCTPVNLLVRCTGSRDRITEPRIPGLLAEIDLNTAPEHQYPISRASIAEYCETAEEVTNQVTQALFSDDYDGERIF